MPQRCTAIPHPRVSLGVVLTLCLVLFSLLAGAIEAQSSQGEAQRLAEEFNAAYQGKDWPRAIDSGLRLLKAVGRNPRHAYNLACVFALNGDRDDALLWLQAAAEFGFAEPDLLATDTDFESLRGEERFAATLERVRRNRTEADERFQRLAQDSEPLVVLPGKREPKKPVPLLIVLHGFGDSSDRFVEGYRDTARWLGAILVAPRSVVPVGQGFEWGTVDQADRLVMGTLEDVLERYNIDRSRILLSGFSQGGFMAYQLAARHPDVFQGVVPIAGRYRPEVAELLAKAEVTPRFYLMVGSEDGAVEANRQGYRELEAAGVSVRLKVYPNLGHNFPPDHERELLRALKFVLKE